MLRATQTINGKARISKQVLLLLRPCSPHCARLSREISRLWMSRPPQRTRPAGHRKGALCSSNHPIKGTAHKLLPAQGQGPLAFKNQTQRFLKCGWRHLLDCVTHRTLIFHQQEMTATLIVICAQCSVFNEMVWIRANRFLSVNWNSHCSFTWAPLTGSTNSPSESRSSRNYMGK